MVSACSFAGSGGPDDHGTRRPGAQVPGTPALPRFGAELAVLDDDGDDLAAVDVAEVDSRLSIGYDSCCSFDRRDRRPHISALSDVR
jgi:hypothetical protein